MVVPMAEPRYVIARSADGWVLPLPSEIDESTLVGSDARCAWMALAMFANGDGHVWTKPWEHHRRLRPGSRVRRTTSINTVSLDILAARCDWIGHHGHLDVARARDALNALAGLGHVAFGRSGRHRLTWITKHGPSLHCDGLMASPVGGWMDLKLMLMVPSGEEASGAS